MERVLLEDMEYLSTTVATKKFEGVSAFFTGEGALFFAAWNGGWSTWESGVDVPGRVGLEYLGECWSTLFEYLGE